MENFEGEKRIENQECFDFINATKEAFIKTFPFLSEDEKSSFLEKLDSISKDKDLISDTESLVKNIRLALITLNNTHTGLNEKIKKEHYELENKIYYKANKFWTDINNATFEVVSLNDVPIVELVEEKKKRNRGWNK